MIGMAFDYTSAAQKKSPEKAILEKSLPGIFTTAGCKTAAGWNN
jgi:hypothetical protein